MAKLTMVNTMSCFLMVVSKTLSIQLITMPGILPMYLILELPNHIILQSMPSQLHITPLQSMRQFQSITDKSLLQNVRSYRLLLTENQSIIYKQVFKIFIWIFKCKSCSFPKNNKHCCFHFLY